MTNFFENYCVTQHGEVYQKTDNEYVWVQPRMWQGLQVLDLFDTKNRKKIRFKIHRLIAQTFIPNPENHNEVIHIDFNKLNNHVDNLKWVPRYYSLHYTKHQNHNATGENHGNAKIREEQVIFIRENFYQMGISQKAMGQMFGINQQAISNILRHKTWNKIKDNE